MEKVSIYNYSLSDRIYVASSEEVSKAILDVLANDIYIEVRKCVLENKNTSIETKIKLEQFFNIKEIKEIKIVKPFYREIKDFKNISYSILYSALRNQLKYLDSDLSKNDLRKEIIKNANNKRIFNKVLKNGNKDEIKLAIENKSSSISFLINVLHSYKFKNDYEIKRVIIESEKVSIELLKRIYFKENMKVEKNLEFLNSLKERIKRGA